MTDLNHDVRSEDESPLADDVAGGDRARESGEQLLRAWQLTHGFAKAMRSAPSTFSSPIDVNWHLTELLNLAVPQFCDWCAIDVVDSSGQVSQFGFRHGRCLGDQCASHDDHCDPLMETEVLARRESVQRAIASGQIQVRGSQGPGTSSYAVVALRVNDQPYGAITFANEGGSPELGDVGVGAAEEVAWGLVGVIERSRLVGANREAVRQTQRIARQLHQLIAASITVTGIRDEQGILRNLAQSTRSVFDGDIAIVAIDDVSSAPLSGVARRGKVAICETPSPEMRAETPILRAGANEPWIDGEWLVAPILRSRDRTRGLIAVRRTTSVGFGPEDREVLMLLSHMASSALGATELGRTIEASEERLRILVETAPIGIVEVDLDGSVRYWNHAASQILAWEEFVGSVGQERPQFPVSTQSELAELWAEAVAGDAVIARDIVGVEVAGRTRTLIVSAAPLPSSNGETAGILTLVDDVTSHRELKDELRHAHTMEVRGQVASRIAHDFNNLLTLISGYAEILSRELLFDDRSAQMVRDIQATASRASLLTRQLQTIGRTKVAERVVFDPAAVMESNAEVLERILGSKIELRWMFDESAGNVRVDPDQFEQMILNLSMNARDAMPDGGRLSFSVMPCTLNGAEASERGLTPGEYVKVSVSDSGHGMDEATREQCFEPLFTTKGPFKGTGMGLASARRLVEESGGGIRCTSRVAEGTTFDIWLPSFTDPVREASVHFEAPRPRGDASVLIVEDDEGLRRLMSQVLRRNGYEVTDAESGERAVELVGAMTTPIDLLLSDVVMGAMTGRDVALHLQAQWPNLSVLLISGTADSTIVDGLREGSSDFLPKPFKPSQLIDKVHELLSRQR